MKLTQYALIGLYLSAVVVANLLTTMFGPAMSIINAFLFIGLDLSTRDTLHEAWGQQKFSAVISLALEDSNFKVKHLYFRINTLWPRMLLLIAAGSLLSWWLNKDAGPIALASFVAFLLSGLTDTVTYTLLSNHTRLTKMNGSNIAAAAVDSLAFPALAFGWPLLWWVVVGQFAAKTVGGFIWSLILNHTAGKRNVTT